MHPMGRPLASMHAAAVNSCLLVCCGCSEVPTLRLVVFVASVVLIDLLDASTRSQQDLCMLASSLHSNAWVAALSACTVNEQYALQVFSRSGILLHTMLQG